MKYINNFWLPKFDTFFQYRLDYELQDYLTVRKYCSSFRTAVDVGAHVGYWSSRLVMDYDIVYAFEPDKEHVQCLRKNVLNHKLVIDSRALSDQEQILKFEKKLGNSGMSRISDIGVNIQTIPLDKLELCNVDLIKIDVEGHEYPVLLGAKNTITKWRPVLIIEILNSLDVKERQAIFDFLAPLNYNMKEIIDENYIFTFTP